MSGWKSTWPWVLLLFVWTAAGAPAQDILWRTYCQDANAAQARGQMSDAEHLHKMALQEAQSFPANDERLAVTYYNFALFYQNQKHLPEAVPLYQHALAIYSKLHGEQHELPVRCLENLGMVYHDLKQFDRAEEYYQRVLSAREAKLG